MFDAVSYFPSKTIHENSLLIRTVFVVPLVSVMGFDCSVRRTLVLVTLGD